MICFRSEHAEETTSEMHELVSIVYTSEGREENKQKGLKANDQRETGHWTKWLTLQATYVTAWK